jgi:hypothetical protein
MFDKRPRISEVKTPGSIRTGGHTKPTPDAPVEVHEYNAVFSLKSRLGGTCTHAWGIFTMVAKHQKRPALQVFIQKRGFLFRKSVFELLFPDPFNLMS